MIFKALGEAEMAKERKNLELRRRNRQKLQRRPKRYFSLQSQERVCCKKEDMVKCIECS